jgi:excinuclease ABC subunit A
VVSGVSGSGKSTLVHDVLYRALERELSGEHIRPRSTWARRWAPTRRWTASGYVDGVALVDQSPIGRTPRSNPATYTKAFDEVRRIFAAEPLSKERGYKAGRFSFNTAGGRCEVCKGAGWCRWRWCSWRTCTCRATAAAAPDTSGRRWT